MLSAHADPPDTRPATPGIPKAAAGDVAAFEGMLRQSRRPMLIVGGGGWSAAAARDLARFSEAHGVPVCASFRCQDYLDNPPPPLLRARRHRARPADRGPLPGRADLLIALGSRLGEITTGGYTLVDIPNPRARFVHVHPGAEEIGRVYRPDLAVNASAASFAAAIADLAPGGAGDAADARQAWARV